MHPQLAGPGKGRGPWRICLCLLPVGLQVQREHQPLPPEHSERLEMPAGDISVPSTAQKRTSEVPT